MQTRQIETNTERSNDVPGVSFHPQRWGGIFTGTPAESNDSNGEVDAGRTRRVSRVRPIGPEGSEGT